MPELKLSDRKDVLLPQVDRYINLLSSLKSPNFDLISGLEYFKGLVQFANSDEIGGLESQFRAMIPADSRSLEYIESGALTGGESNVRQEKSAFVSPEDVALIARVGPTSGNRLGKNE